METATNMSYPANDTGSGRIVSVGSRRLPGDSVHQAAEIAGGWKLEIPIFQLGIVRDDTKRMTGSWISYLQFFVQSHLQIAILFKMIGFYI